MGFRGREVRRVFSIEAPTSASTIMGENKAVTTRRLKVLLILLAMLFAVSCGPSRETVRHDPGRDLEASDVGGMDTRARELSQAQPRVAIPERKATASSLDDRLREVCRAIVAMLQARLHEEHLEKGRVDPLSILLKVRDRDPKHPWNTLLEMIRIQFENTLGMDEFARTFDLEQQDWTFFQPRNETGMPTCPENYRLPEHQLDIELFHSERLRKFGLRARILRLNSRDVEGGGAVLESIRGAAYDQARIAYGEPQPSSASMGSIYHPFFETSQVCSTMSRIMYCKKEAASRLWNQRIEGGSQPSFDDIEFVYVGLKSHPEVPDTILESLDRCLNQGLGQVTSGVASPMDQATVSRLLEGSGSPEFALSREDDLDNLSFAAAKALIFGDVAPTLTRPDVLEIHLRSMVTAGSEEGDPSPGRIIPALAGTAYLEFDRGPLSLEIVSSGECFGVRITSSKRTVISGFKLFAGDRGQLFPNPFTPAQGAGFRIHAGGKKASLDFTDQISISLGTPESTFTFHKNGVDQVFAEYLYNGKQYTTPKRFIRKRPRGWSGEKR